MHEWVTYKRDVLYEQVWAKPVRDVAREYGVSDVALAKICRKLDVPLPGRGYWARVAAGQRLKRTPLPGLKKGGLEALRGQRSRRSALAAQLLDDARARSAAVEVEVSVTVAEALTDPHPLVAEAGRLLQKAKPGSDGIVACLDRRCLAIRVTRPLLERALRIMDALVKALEAYGYRVDVTEPEKHRVWTPSVTYRDAVMPVTRVQVDGELISIILDEDTDTIERSRTDPPRYDVRQRYEQRPNGRLRLRIQTEISGYRNELPRARWQDGAKKRVEDHVGSFVRGLVVAAAHLKVARTEAERRRAEQAERERQVGLEQKRREIEELRCKHLLDELSRWKEARDIRAYAAEIRRTIEEGQCTLAPDGDLDQWLRWCDARVERLDPLAALRRNVAEVHAARQAAERTGACERDAASVADGPFHAGKGSGQEAGAADHPPPEK